MVVQISQPPDADAPGVDAGVIKDARLRQRRQRAAVATIVAAALLAGLLLGLPGGGGGHPGEQARGHGRSPAGGDPGSGRPLSTPLAAAPAGISQIGLLAPGVGWVATQNGLYITRNGGRNWARTHVPGLGPNATAGIAESTSPAPSRVALVFSATDAYGACPMPGFPGPAPIDALASSSDAGRSWRTYTLSSCVDPYSLSFAGAGTGFMAAWKGESSRARALYATTDGGQRWHRVARLPFPGWITFATARLGLSMAFWSDATTGVAGTPGRIALYRTTDGGRSWRRQRICRWAATQTTAVSCQTPIATGPRSFLIPAVVTNNRTRRTRPIVYATADGGRTWSVRTLPAPPASQQHQLYGRVTLPFSAPDSQHLFMLVGSSLYRSADSGRSWTHSRAPSGTLDFASATYGWDMAGQHLYYTTDAGRVWRRFRER